MNHVEIPASPCNSRCEIDLNTQLCKGCYRYMDEIINWENYSHDKKRELLNTIDKRRKAYTED